MPAVAAFLIIGLIVYWRIRSESRKRERLRRLFEDDTPKKKTYVPIDRYKWKKDQSKN